jgi:opacity protein-like surface antigen
LTIFDSNRSFRNSEKQNNFQMVLALRTIQRCVFVLGIVALVIFRYDTAMGGEEYPSSGTPPYRLFSESSLILGYGSGFIHKVDYETALIILHLGVNLDRYFPSLNSYKGKLSFFIEPQFNPVINSESDYELGLGLGLQYRYPVNDKLSAYIRAGISPHYISIVTIHQANGFIFSDLVGAGVYYHLTDSSAINLGFWFRHLSNATMEKPNDGVNTFIGVIGYSFFFN